MSERYNVVRMYFGDIVKEVILEEVSLEEAQEHCGNPETSSSTCTNAEGVARTERVGPWFDGYEEA